MSIDELPAASSTPQAEEAMTSIDPSAVINPIDVAIDHWFSEFMHNSPVSQITPIFNYVQSAVQTLKNRLKEI